MTDIKLKFLYNLSYKMKKYHLFSFLKKNAKFTIQAFYKVQVSTLFEKFKRKSLLTKQKIFPFFQFL